jgi:hypothetical protein
MEKPKQQIEFDEMLWFEFNDENNKRITNRQKIKNKERKAKEDRSKKQAKKKRTV